MALTALLLAAPACGDDGPCGDARPIPDDALPLPGDATITASETIEPEGCGDAYRVELTIDADVATLDEHLATLGWAPAPCPTGRTCRQSIDDNTFVSMRPCGDGQTCAYVGALEGLNPG